MSRMKMHQVQKVRFIFGCRIRTGKASRCFGVNVVDATRPTEKYQTISSTSQIIMLPSETIRLRTHGRAVSEGQAWTTSRALTLIAGLMLVTDPLLALGFLTITLAAYLIVDGIVEIAAGDQLRPAPGSGWLIFGGVMSVILGIMIWAQYPLSGAFVIGILPGIKLFVVGLLMITGRASSGGRTADGIPGRGQNTNETPSSGPRTSTVVLSSSSPSPSVRS
jgi:hypothetical protein